jgi:hypothetical protein
MDDVPEYATPTEGDLPTSLISGGGLEGDANFDLRISFEGISREDAFCVALPVSFANSTLHDMICLVFPDDQDDQARMIESFDLHTNPDLPDLYVTLLNMIDERRNGHSTLRFFVSDGLEVDLKAYVSDHLLQHQSTNGVNAGAPVFNLFIEQTFDVLARHVDQGGDRAALLNWMKGCTLIYFMDKHRHRPPIESTERDWYFEFAVEDLRARGLIAPNQEGTAWTIARAGRRFIGHMIAETESYIKHFDVFRDVEYDGELEIIRFGTGRGDDLRVQVFEAEGMDSIKVVFMLRLYDGTLDRYRETWLDAVNTDEFFNEILRPVLDHDRADGELIDWIIESGYAHNEEQTELAREKASQLEIRRRLRSG